MSKLAMRHTSTLPTLLPKAFTSESTAFFLSSGLMVLELCCSVLYCVAVRCSVLQCVAVCCSEMLCDAVCCSVLQCVVLCCSEHSLLLVLGAHGTGAMLQCVVLCCSVLQCVAVRCCAMQCVAVYCIVLQRAQPSSYPRGSWYWSYVAVCCIVL